jgi:hypothetical protein
MPPHERSCVGMAPRLGQRTPPPPPAGQTARHVHVHASGVTNEPMLCAHQGVQTYSCRSGALTTLTSAGEEEAHTAKALKSPDRHQVLWCAESVSERSEPRSASSGRAVK